jgi:hypothetical protein
VENPHEKKKKKKETRRQRVPTLPGGSPLATYKGAVPAGAVPAQPRDPDWEALLALPDTATSDVTDWAGGPDVLDVWCAAFPVRKLAKAGPRYMRRPEAQRHQDHWLTWASSGALVRVTPRDGGGWHAMVAGSVSQVEACLRAWGIVPNDRPVSYWLARWI